MPDWYRVRQMSMYQTKQICGSMTLWTCFKIVLIIILWSWIHVSLFHFYNDALSLWNSWVRDLSGGMCACYTISKKVVLTAAIAVAKHGFLLFCRSSIHLILTLKCQMSQCISPIHSITPDIHIFKVSQIHTFNGMLLIWTLSGCKSIAQEDIEAVTVG